MVAAQRLWVLLKVQIDSSLVIPARGVLGVDFAGLAVAMEGGFHIPLLKQGVTPTIPGFVEARIESEGAIVASDRRFPVT